MDTRLNPITALYCRSARKDNLNGESESITNQKQILTQYAQDNGFENTSFFVDEGWTGSNLERPAFMEMMEGVKNGTIKTIIVKDYARLGRNALIVGTLLNKDFALHGVRCVTVAESIDTMNGQNTLLPLIAFYDERYAREMSKKIKAGLAFKAQRDERKVKRLIEQNA